MSRLRKQLFVRIFHRSDSRVFPCFLSIVQSLSISLTLGFGIEGDRVGIPGLPASRPTAADIMWGSGEAGRRELRRVHLESPQRHPSLHVRPFLNSRYPWWTGLGTAEARRPNQIAHPQPRWGSGTSPAHNPRRNTGTFFRCQVPRTLRDRRNLPPSPPPAPSANYYIHLERSSWRRLFMPHCIVGTFDAPRKQSLAATLSVVGRTFASSPG